MVVAKPYSRKQAAKYVARAIERIRADEIRSDGREVLAEPLLERLMAEFRPELTDLGTVTRKQSEPSRAVRYGARRGRLPLQVGLTNGAVILENGQFIERRVQLRPVRILAPK